jgi:hypothetical protein
MRALLTREVAGTHACFLLSKQPAGERAWGYGFCSPSAFTACVNDVPHLQRYRSIRSVIPSLGVNRLPGSMFRSLTFIGALPHLGHAGVRLSMAVPHWTGNEIQPKKWQFTINALCIKASRAPTAALEP